MAAGLILVVFLGVLCAWLVSRARKRMGWTTASSLWVTIVVGAVLVILVIYVAQQPN